MEIKQLIDDYIHWLKKEITFEKIGEYYEITTPFLNSANDFIQIYVRIDKDTIFFTYDSYFLTIHSNIIYVYWNLSSDFLHSFMVCFNVV